MAWIDCKSQDFGLVAGASDDKESLHRLLAATVEARSERQPGARQELCRSRSRSKSWRSRRAWIAAMASSIEDARAGRMATVEEATLISASPPPWTLAALRRAGGGRADARSASVSFASSASSAREAALGCKSGRIASHLPSMPARGFSEMHRTASHGNGKIIGQQGRLPHRRRSGAAHRACGLRHRRARHRASRPAHRRRRRRVCRLRPRRSSAPLSPSR